MTEREEQIRRTSMTEREEQHMEKRHMEILMQPKKQSNLIQR